MSIYGIRNRPDFVNYVSSLSGTRTDSHAYGTGNKRYYSSVDAEIYFGDFYVDEIAHIAYSIEQNIMPLYGYNSYVFDEMAIGSRIINGQFTVNFTKSNYLIDLLSKLENNSIKQISEQTSKEDDGEESDLIDSSFSEPIDASITDKTGSNQFTSTNYQGIKQNKRPLWHTGFDIDVMFGRSTTSAKTEHVMLEGVYLMNSMLNLDHSGQPVSETYTFMARDVRTVSA